jgi:hypothetical protein
MYGIGYSHHNASFLPSDTNWGMYVTANGAVGSFLSGSTSANSFIMGKLGIGTNNPQIDLAIGDSDTGFHQQGDGELAIYTNSAERVRIDNGGKVGIGENNPRNELHLRGWMFFQGPSTNDNYGWKVGTSGSGNDEENFNFYRVRNNTEERWAYVEDDQSAVGKLDFTGQHRTQFSENNDEIIENVSNYVGLIVSSCGEYVSGETINEAIPCVELANSNNDKKVFGVISNAEDKNEDFREYKQGNFVSVIRKEENDDRVIINSLGEGCIWVCDANGALENGDFITTTELAPGYGIKQNDDLLHNYTVAKITRNEDFSDMTNGKVLENGIKCKFVGCTYHCG